MSTKALASSLTTKESRQFPDGKVVAPAVGTGPAKPPTAGLKITISKVVTKDSKEMSPVGSQDEDRPELLGSLTTQQQQRTSARVIKKLRLEPQPDRKCKRSDGASDEIPDCETPNKLEDKDLKFPTVKQRMPKALWSTDEKNLFFEALNEYGKDFDAITAHICAKMKKKGMPDVNLKTKTQVSHFYYRTWHKLSKHVHFDENVKKVAQELYALINYGELRKKLVSVNEKTCGRLGEMVLGGSIVVRARGRNLRVRTPMCRALRRLNQITERACGSVVMGRLQILLRARDAASWTRVQAAAHNPRLAIATPPRTRLADLLKALAKRWRGNIKHKLTDIEREDQEEMSQEEEGELEDHLSLETDRIILQELKSNKKLSLHVGPRPSIDIHLPVLVGSEQLSSQDICFSSYLNRCQGAGDGDNHNSKIRTPKRQRKDSATEKDKEIETKRIKTDDTDKLIIIEETAIDGIELMANYKNNIEDERPSTEDEKEIKEDIVEEDIEKDICDKDKEISEKDKGLTDKLKAICDKDKGLTDKLKAICDKEKDISEKYKSICDKDKVICENKDVSEKDIPEKDILERDKDMSEREKDSFSEMEDDEKYNKSDTDNESDHGKSKETKFKNLKVKFRIRPKKRGKSIYRMVMDDDKDESKEDKDIDVDLALSQIRKGWSVYDAGDLTIGDLYLMFGNRSKLELDYWWAEPTPPLPIPTIKLKPELDKDSNKDRLVKSERQDKGTDSSLEDEKEKRESDTDIFSPKNTFSQDSNDGMSGDERKLDSLASPDHKSSSTLKLVSKLINRPTPAHTQSQDGFSLLSERLKRLLAMAGNPSAGAGAGAGGRARCGGGCACGAACGARGRPSPPPPAPAPPLFRLPPPLAPKECGSPPLALDLSGVPRGRRGRPRAPDRRVVVQRLLPLLPKLPPPSPLIPVKIVPNSAPTLPKILPKPPPSSTSDLSFFYVLSESNGQFFFHDGDRKIPITQTPEAVDNIDEMKEECSDKEEASTSEAKDGSSPKPERDDGEPNNDVNDHICSMEREGERERERQRESSLSPARLLRDPEWLEDPRLQDFSLSSFLAHLDARPPSDLVVDSQLHSLMAESSVDYVAKFADLAAKVTADTDPPISSE